MTQLKISLPLPKYWQDFEDLTAAVLPYYYSEVPATQHGRPGQAQDGVDVYLMNPRDHKWIGVQCKRMEELAPNGDPRPGGVVSENFLLAQIREAEKFSPALSHFILATTARTDAKIQKQARLLTAERLKQGKFSVSVWGWEAYETILNTHHEVLKRYYQTIIHALGPADEDKIIVDTICEAFRRPAFSARIDTEHMDDFLQALKDTMKMLNTGVLVDRETRAVIYRTVGGVRAISDPALKSQLEKVSQDLQRLRADFERGIADDMIRPANGYVRFVNPGDAHSLQQQRDSIVSQIRTVANGLGLSL
ncbi:hypothetical protein [Pseudomonas helleri]|uniref:hypothetical protein n=1 Tax=Pseudomonas helleri TaxID=1608996 RepID=UPI0024304F86|nr:hypothetical protein [Pseudomonas helleri]